MRKNVTFGAAATTRQIRDRKSTARCVRVAARSAQRYVPLSVLIVLAAGYLLSEILNYLLSAGLSAILVLSGALSVASLLGARGRSAQISTKSLVAATILFLCYQVASIGWSPRDLPIDDKFLSSVVAAVTLCWIVVGFEVEAIFHSTALLRTTALAMIAGLVASRLGADVMVVLGNEINNKAGLYTEPSHFALYLLPILGILLLRKGFDIVGVAVSIGAIVLCFSATLAIGLAGITLVKIGRTRWKAAMCIVIVIAAVFTIEQNLYTAADTHISERVAGIADRNEVGARNLSALVWLNGWSQAIEDLKASHGLGVGINRMGYGTLQYAGRYTPEILSREQNVLNASDGSFVAAKLIAEFGIAGILLVVVLAILCLRSIVNYIRSGEAPLTYNASILSAGMSVSLLTYLFVRGISIFSFPFVLMITCLCVRRRPSTPGYE